MIKCTSQPLWPDPAFAQQPHLRVEIARMEIHYFLLALSCICASNIMAIVAADFTITVPSTALMPTQTSQDTLAGKSKRRRPQYCPNRRARHTKEVYWVDCSPEARSISKVCCVTASAKKHGQHYTSDVQASLKSVMRQHAFYEGYWATRSNGWSCAFGQRQTKLVNKALVSHWEAALDKLIQENPNIETGHVVFFGSNRQEIGCQVKSQP
ncbi:hypothetical protein K461DRAFT_270194 [Myriangium duriaei CBS 260.36]|uniref:Uncharacterized protein n=1 Tax=Myriangium duriaei CBS 260.36 TaxID=1168546 RepID=A0A9P4J1Q8_9PEZI|nr:hypothetical protein K461DRAFT_270194 [Myriangium duriaei CBS 260.36]